MKEYKQGFSKFYNKCHKRKGYFWADRFKNLIVDNSNTLIILMAYVDLNAVRAGIVSAPKDYRWCSLGHHFQSGNKDKPLSTDLGVAGQEMMDDKKRFRHHNKLSTLPY